MSGRYTKIGDKVRLCPCDGCKDKIYTIVDLPPNSYVIEDEVGQRQEIRSIYPISKTERKTINS